MLRLTQTEAVEHEAERLSRALLTGSGPTCVVAKPDAGRSRVLQALKKRHPEAVTLVLPESPDQIDYALLDGASKLGPGCVEAVDEALRSSPEVLEPALHTLEENLGARPLFVDGVDRVGRLGSDRQLPRALEAQLRAFEDWLSHRPGVQTLSTGHPDLRIRWRRPPLQLSNGRDHDASQLWLECDGDIDEFQLALEHAALEGSPARMPLRPPSRLEVETMLPEDILELLDVLAMHGRPLKRTIVDSLGLSGSIDSGLRLGLWLDWDEHLRADDGWSSWRENRLTDSQRVRHHLQLARAFSRELSDKEEDLARSSATVLETFRHFIHAGEIATARRFARHGAGLLISHARQRSLGGAYHDAAKAYETALDIAEHDGLALPKRMVAYARHYMHFNRAHPKDAREPIADTISGYEVALRDWPENALFWSRLVRARFYAEQPDAALETLTRAREKVPPHPLRETFLVARTARGLLEHDRVFEAALIWADYEPTNEHGRNIEQNLRNELRSGWEARRVCFPHGPQVFFNRPLRIHVLRSEGPSWLAEIPQLDTLAQARSPSEALRVLATTLQDETRALLKRLTHTLDPELRLRKRILLGAVDVVASRLNSWQPEFVWIFGALEREGQDIIFCAHDGGRHRVPQALLTADFMPTGHPRFARIKADEHARPIGEVIEIGEPFRRPATELWEEWQRRIADGE